MANEFAFKSCEVKFYDVDYFDFWQRNIRSIKQFVSMKEDDRRALLRTFTDDEYRDVMNVCAGLPNVTMEVSSKGKRNDEIQAKADELIYSFCCCLNKYITGNLSQFRDLSINALAQLFENTFAYVMERGPVTRFHETW